MSTGDRQVEFNIEEKLAELKLTPAQRAEALASVRIAQTAVELVARARAALRRFAELVALKPSVRT